MDRDAIYQSTRTMLNNLSTQINWISRNKPYIPNPEIVTILKKHEPGQNSNLFNDLISKSNDRSQSRNDTEVDISYMEAGTSVNIPNASINMANIGINRGVNTGMNRGVNTGVNTSNTINTINTSNTNTNTNTNTRSIPNTNIGINRNNISHTDRTPSNIGISRSTSTSSNINSTINTTVNPGNRRKNDDDNLPNKRHKSTNSFNATSTFSKPIHQLSTNTNEDIYKKYIKLLTMKTNLLTQRYIIFESSSISLDDKNKFIENEFKGKFASIEKNLNRLNQILPIELNEIDENIDSISAIEPRIQEPSTNMEPITAENGSDVNLDPPRNILTIEEHHRNMNNNQGPRNIQVENSFQAPTQVISTINSFQPPLKSDSYKELVEPDFDPFEEFDKESISRSPRLADDLEITQVKKFNVIDLSADADSKNTIHTFESDNELDLISSDLFRPSDVKRFHAPPRPSAPPIPSTPPRTFREPYPPRTPEENEDEFGEGEMEGLLTPTQDIDDDDTDLGGFIADDVSEEDFTFAYSEDNDSVQNSQITIHSEGDIIVEKQEIQDLKLSQDVAENYGIDYDDFDLSTQVNDEREVNYEIIQVNDESDYDYDAEPIFIKPEPNDADPNDEEPFDIDDDSVIFSDDDELHQLGITTSKDIINEHLKTYPGNEQLIKSIYHTLNTVFKLQNFRSNQFEAIINFLMGKDVFVLMPTGGGKSLCYQLPALVKHRNQGITIVISPLISLMQDQINHLLKNNIKAGMISSKNTPEERREILDLFRHGKLDLVYLSPEMVNGSTNIQRIIQHLYDNNLLGKIVVDEAHCISSWGHDFRPDYKGMNYFKNNFPNVPVMALTATANEKVKLDIIHNLNMNSPKILKQSFNRINLYYEIKWKSTGYLEDIRQLIEQKFRDKTGIIYCHSKQSCEQISSKLNSYGLNTSFYHAGMTTQDRFQVQNDWQDETIKVICATIAFGMGIDKPNVRFVIHSFLPRNLEGYYQETGRAGRDGFKSQCIMYYSYKDARNLKLMIQKDKELNQTTKDNHLLKLRQVVQYCENVDDCRRKQVLQYFNETFNPKDCGKNCDNCNNNNGVQIEKNVTDVSKQILKMVGEIEREKVTLLYCQDIFKGSNYAKINTNGHNKLQYHGMGKKVERLELERIFFHLISEDCLCEYSVMKGGFASNYVKLGKNANRVLNGTFPMIIKLSSSSGSGSGGGSSFSGCSFNGNNNVTTTTNIGFVSAKTNQPIRLPPNSLSQYVNQNNNQHVEKCYRELNQIRNNKKNELNYQDANSILSDESLKEVSIFLPITKTEFKKYTNNSDQLSYFIYFKTKLIELHKERFGKGSQGQSQGQGQRSQQRSQGQGQRSGQRPQGRSQGRSQGKSQNSRSKFKKAASIKKNRQKAMPL